MKKIQVKKFKYNLFEPPIQSGNGLTIIIYHGWGTTVDSFNDLAVELTKIGHTVIVPEMVFHDSRNPLKNHFATETTQTYFWKTIFATIDEFNEFIDEVGILREKIILVGSSMGGFIANGIFAKQKELSGLVNVNGSGSFMVSEKLFREESNRPPLTSPEEMTMNKYDPINRKNCDAPVLLMHGDSDKIISIKGQEDYFNYLTEDENRNNVTLLVYKNVNHQFSEDMVNDLIEWINKSEQ